MQINKKGTIYLVANKTYKVGRFIDGQASAVEIPIGSDQSISRLHAEIQLTYDENDCVIYHLTYYSHHFGLISNKS